MMMNVSVYDTKPYDRQSFQAAVPSGRIEWQFYEFRLEEKTALTAKGSQVVCVFVNDKVNSACLNILADSGVRLVALRCAGFNNVDLDAAKQRNIGVTRVPSYSPHAVAEHAVGLLLTLNRKIHRAYLRVREFNFSLSGLTGFDIAGKTVGIVGTGKIGKIAAEIFAGFKARVIAYDPFPSPEWAQKNHIEYVPYARLLSSSDIISLHSPLMPETFHLINEQAIQSMKKGVYLVNTSRGKLVDTKALIQGLKSGHIGGVALDVYEEEEGIFFEDLSGQVLQDDELSRLLTFHNVLITSHQAFLTQEALSEIARVTTDNVMRLHQGKPFLEGSQLV